MPDPDRHDLLDRLDQWADTMGDPAADAPGSFLEAVAHARHARRRRHAGIASGVLVVALVGAWVALRPAPTAPSPAPPPIAHQPEADPPAPAAKPLDLRSATLFAVMRANDGYAREDIVLPEPIVLTWALENPLGS